MGKRKGPPKGIKGRKGKSKAKARSRDTYAVGIWWVGLLMTYLTVFVGFASLIQGQPLFNFIMTINGALQYMDVVTGVFVILLVVATLDMVA